MAAAFFANDCRERATFELFARRLPPNRSYLVVAGLEQALDYLENLAFTKTDTDFLRRLPVFREIDSAFFDYLSEFRFTGDVWAIAEGRLAFAGEPLIRIAAPIIEAQIVETFLLSTINFQTLIASKAARLVDAARGRGIIEFGSRRAHGMGAALYAARAAFIGGCIGTSNLEAGRTFGLPVFGTSAHSFVTAFPSEIEAFRAYFKVFPKSTTLLLDTFDTEAAARLATEFGSELRGVRLDSGDLGALAISVRSILDRAGMTETQIMASGDLNEASIASLLEAGAPIDLFGVGTELATSYDAPALGGVYKMVELEKDGRRVPKLKLSPGKATYPGSKQVWRSFVDDNTFLGDLIALWDEEINLAEYQPLLEQVISAGRRTHASPDLRLVRQHAREELARLPLVYKRITGANAYPVRYSDALERERQALSSHLQARAN